MFAAARIGDPVTHDAVVPAGIVAPPLVPPVTGAVIIEGMPAAFVTCTVVCTGAFSGGMVHPPLPPGTPPLPIIKGSAGVFINGFPAARWAPSGDIAACGVLLGDPKRLASRTVLIGDVGIAGGGAGSGAAAAANGASPAPAAAATHPANAARSAASAASKAPPAPAPADLEAVKKAWLQEVLNELPSDAQAAIDAAAPAMRAEDAAQACGMKGRHVENLSARTASRSELAVLRASNPHSLRYQDDPMTVPKPTELSMYKTAKSGPHAGLVVDQAGAPVLTSKGERVHADYDMQGVYNQLPDSSLSIVKNTDSRDFLDAMNDDVTPERRMFQHGTNDTYKHPDGSMKRNPDPGEKYLISEPDGTIRVATSTQSLKDYYIAKGMPWPYQVPPYPPAKTV